MSEEIREISYKSEEIASDLDLDVKIWITDFYYNEFTFNIKCLDSNKKISKVLRLDEDSIMEDIEETISEFKDLYD